MNRDEFLVALQNEASTFTSAVATADGEWIIKGFIDIYKRIYTISVDTKVISKVLELLLLPAFAKLLISLASSWNWLLSRIFILTSRLSLKRQELNLQ